MPLIRDEELVRVELPAEGEHAMLKPRPSIGERKRLQGMGFKLQLQAKMGASAISDEGEIAIPISPEDFVGIYFSGVEMAVKELYVSPGAGKPPTRIQPTPETLRDLDAESFKVLTDWLDVNWVERSDDDVGNSSKNGRTSSKASEASPTR